MNIPASYSIIRAPSPARSATPFSPTRPTLPVSLPTPQPTEPPDSIGPLKSLSLMLPVATASNAFVYGTGRITTLEMAREGFALNLAGCIVITAVSMLVLG